MIDEIIHRRLFAKQMLARAFVETDSALEAAFSNVARESFVGLPPWYTRDANGYRAIPSSDPIVLYQDILVALDPVRTVNNGSPSLHAGLLHRLSVKPGEHVVHLGAGTGYYTAILAELVGSKGQVTAVEYDAKLAAQAQKALEPYRQVAVQQGSAFEWRGEAVDAIYVNFAIDHPPIPWVNSLAVGGRLIFPLGVPAMDRAGRATGVTARAGMLYIERKPGGFAAEFLQAVSFVWAEGAQTDADRQEHLMEAFRQGGLLKVRSLRLGPVTDEQEWYGESEWGLSFQDI